MISSVHIIGSKNSGGAERFYMRMLQGLTEQDQVVAAINRPDSMVARELGTSVPQYHVPMRNVYDVFSRWQISKIVNKLNPDIVQTYMGRATRLTHLRKQVGPLHVARLGGFYKLAGYRHAHAWVGNTRSICDYLTANGFPADRVFHIRNFVESPQPVSSENIESKKNILDLPGDALIIMGLGRLIAKKGFYELLKAFSELPIFDIFHTH